MALAGKAKEAGSGGGGDFYTVPKGTHQGRVVGVIDLGTHPSKSQDGQIRDNRQIAILLEILELDDPKAPTPCVMAMTMPLYFGERAKIRKLIEETRPEGKYKAGEIVDPTILAGMPVDVKVSPKTAAKSGNEYTVAESFWGVDEKKARRWPEATVEPIVFDSESDDDAPTATWMPEIYDFERGAFTTIPGMIARSKERSGDMPTSKPATKPATNGQHATVDAKTMASRSQQRQGKDEVPF